MTKYHFKARNLSNKKIYTGYLNTSSNEDLKNILLSHNLHLITSYKVIENNIFLYEYKLTNQDILTLCERLYMMIKSGISLKEAIDKASASFISNKILSIRLEEISKELEKGTSIKKALDKYKNYFPKYFKTMFSLIESTGLVSLILKDLIKYYKSKIKFDKKLKSSLFYPITLFSFAVIIFIFLMFEIIPSFENIFNSMNVNIPLITKIILNASLYIRSNYLNILAIVCSIILFVIILSKTKKCKYNISKFKIKHSLFKSFFITNVTLEFTRILKTMIDSGIDIKSSLNKTINLLSNEYLKDELYISLKEVERGCALDQALDSIGIFPKLFISTISISQESHSISYSLNTLIDVYDDERLNLLDKFTQLVEPISMIFISLIVIVVIVSIYLPLFSIFDGLII